MEEGIWTRKTLTIAHGNQRAAGKRCVQGCLTEGNINKRVCRNDENENLGAAGDVVVDKAALVEVGEVVVNGSIVLRKQKPFEHVIPQSEQSDKGDRENKGREWGQSGNAGHFHSQNMSIRIHVGPHGGNDGDGVLIFFDFGMMRIS